MARLLQHLVEAPRPCSYLAAETAMLEHRILVDVSTAELDRMLERGWRRFGPDYFRPKCAPCAECISTRVPVATFAPTKSQRRARRACNGLTVEMAKPRVDGSRLDLYHAWHAFREAEREWPSAELDPRSYYATFAFPHAAGRELTYRDPDGKLVGVAITDETEVALSLIYFFYDPAWAMRSIGTANITFHVDIARRLGLRHIYLGYRVAECPSMQYKLRFRPQEVLRGRPADDETAEWVLEP